MSNRYLPLKKYVAARGGLRVALRPTVRDELVEHCVNFWPEGCQHPEDVLLARSRIYLRERYGFPLGTFLAVVMARIVVQLIIEWWLSRDTNRILMAGWRRRAKEA